jgi:peptidylprolyl isomerase
MATFEDYYKILQVSPSAESEVIEAAYKKLAQKYHPDVNNSSMAADKMKKINIAYDVLRDPVQREKYQAKWVQKMEKKTSRAGTSTPTKSKPSSKSQPRQQQLGKTTKPSLAAQLSKNKGKVIAYAIAGLLVLVAIPLILMNTVFSARFADTAKVDDIVQVHYTGKLADSTVFDSSVGGEPIEFTIGSGQLIPGFDEAVRGMKVGEKKTVTIPAEEAYGAHLDGLTAEIPLDKMPEGKVPEIGQRLIAVNPNGTQAIVTVISISDNVVVVDTNHPLAGQDLIFEIELVKIVKSS